ncbi:MAG TPA: DNRLRE domain-containing protein, partial [Actinoplanes sp.]|nr:DNRLRE domain-containing protein [Actinoplanes sp.]
MKRGFVGAALAGVVVSAGAAIAGTASAATATESLTVYASDDAYTSSVRTKVNFGSADKLVVGRSGGETRLSYLKFVVKPLSSGSRLSGVELRLPADGTPVPATLTLLRVPSTSWSENKITAANAPKIGAAVASIKPAVTDTVLRFDVSGVVTKAGTYAFALKSAAKTEVTRLRSVEYGDDTTGGPELKLTVTKTVTTTPPVEPTVEPTTEPTVEPTVEPTTEPTTEPTVEPTVEPT